MSVKGWVGFMGMGKGGGVEELQIKEKWLMFSTCLNSLSVVFFTTLKAKA